MKIKNIPKELCPKCNVEFKYNYMKRRTECPNCGKKPKSLLGYF